PAEAPPAPVSEAAPAPTAPGDGAPQASDDASLAKPQAAEAQAEAPAQERAPRERREPAVPPQPVPDVPPAPQPHDLSRIAQDLQIRKAQVEAVVQLLDEENTVPFITRYRKERTGGLNEDAIRRIQDRVKSLRALADRKQSVLKSMAYQ